MTPILGITASSISAGLLAGDYESIATVSVTTATQTNITLSNIPSGYRHLQIRLIARGSNADTAGNIFMRLNGDTGSNYSWHYLQGDGSAASSSGTGNATSILCSRITAANAGANIFGTAIIDILDYTDTNKYTTIRSLTGQDQNGAGQVRLDSGSWRNTAAVTSITFLYTNFVQNSTFALYGIR
jgi:hypothetical protein